MHKKDLNTPIIIIFTYTTSVAISNIKSKYSYSGSCTKSTEIHSTCFQLSSLKPQYTNLNWVKEKLEYFLV